MKAVFDTNVLISALITTGKPRILFSKVVEREIQLIISREILFEFSRVAADPRIRKYAKEENTIAFLEVIGRVAQLVKIESRFKAVKDDPNDDIILRTACDGKADAIVSGDKHLLSLGTFREIRILTVDQMLGLLSERKKNTL